MSSVPRTSAPVESAATVVIGSGLPGLAVASELSRRGVHAIVVSGYGGPLADGRARRPAADSGTVTERNELLRLLRTYASNHAIDVRTDSRAASLELLTHEGSRRAIPQRGTAWAVHTDQGLIMADNVVLTSCAENQLRRVLKSVGIAAGRDVAAAVGAIGMYLVGIGELLAPTTREIVRQAKLVSDAIVSQRTPAAMPAAAG